MITVEHIPNIFMLVFNIAQNAHISGDKCKCVISLIVNEEEYSILPHIYYFVKTPCVFLVF